MSCITQDTILNSNPILDPNSIRYIRLLKQTILDIPYKVELWPNVVKKDPKDPKDKRYFASLTQIENGAIWPLRAHTMIGLKRMNNIEYCIKQIIENQIPGDIIETGVWRGGTCIFIQGIMKTYNEIDPNKYPMRNLYVADSFAGFPLANPDIKVDHDKYSTYYNDEIRKFMSISLDEVQTNFKNYDLLDPNVFFIEGFFNKTLPYVISQNIITELALLRVDCDMYESTNDVLNTMYDKVTKGGYVIIDDYGLKGCRMAIDEFREKHNIQSKIIHIDDFGVYWIKE
jgi:hypothetical protein